MSTTQSIFTNALSSSRFGAGEDETLPNISITGKRINKGDLEYWIDFGKSRQWIKEEALTQEHDLIEEFEKKCHIEYMKIFNCYMPNVEQEEAQGFKRGRRLRKKVDYNKFREKLRKIHLKRKQEDKDKRRFTRAGSPGKSQMSEITEYHVVRDRKNLTKQPYEPETEKFSPIRPITSYTEAMKYVHL